jgi:hypothetical protein
MTELKQADLAVSQRITPAFLEGDEVIDLTPYESALPTGRIIEADVVVDLLDEAESRFASQPSRSDMWLGPRIHAGLRLTRAEAANPGLWAWLSLGSTARYLRWRWGPSPQVARFTGPYYTHGLARLWWMAELFRNGADYRPTEAALQNADIAQNFLRMDIAHHRPTCQAFMRIPSRRRPGEALTGREANALAKAVNCAATTIAYEALAPDVPLDGEARREWINEEVDAVDLIDRLPEGPGDPEVPHESVAAMTEIMTEIFAEAPIRDEVKAAAESGAADS